MIQNNINLSSTIITQPELFPEKDSIFTQVDTSPGEVIKISDVKNFEKHLRKQELEDNTIKAYSHSVRLYLKKYKSVNKKNLLAYKASLIEQYRPNTVNLRLQGINKYLEYLHKSSLKLKFVKVQQKPFLENVNRTRYREHSRRPRK